MTGLVRFFVEHRTAAHLLLLAMVLSGLAAATQIRAQFFPDVAIDRMNVRAVWDGAGPEAVDSRIIDALEPALLRIQGVEEVSSLARDGLATIDLEFEPGVDLGAAADEVEAAVSAASLPAELDSVTVRRIAYRDRVTYVVITGPVPINLLVRYAEEVRRALFRAGATRTTLEGAPERRILVEPRPDALARHQISFAEITEAISAELSRRPAGALGETGARVSAGAARADPATVAEIAVRAVEGGEALRVRDLARVTVSDEAGVVRFYDNGAPAVRLRVDRTAGGDSIALQRVVENIVAEIAPSLPEGVDVRLTRTRAQYIQDRLNVLLDNAAWGLAIVLTFLFLFLSARTAFWVAAGVPAAMLTTIALMWAFGLSMNVVSLFALIIALGIVVDDAIVVGEHADRLARDGASPSDAAVGAARRMAGPVLSASITTIIAFAALTAVSGRFGALIVDLPLTLIMVLTASLVEAFLILPAHMRHALAAQARDSWIDAPSRFVTRWFDAARDRLFRPALKRALAWRYATLVLAVALVANAVALYLDGSLRWRFFVGPERSTVTANFAMQAEATRADTLAMVDEMARALRVVDARFEAEHGVAPVVSSLAKVGGTAGRGLSRAEVVDRDLLAGFEVEMVEPDQRPFTQRAFLGAWRDEIVDHPKLETLSLRGARSGPGGDAIDVRLYGTDDARTLKAASEALQTALSRLPGVGGVEDSLPYDKPELVLTLTPLGESLGFTTEAVAAALRARLEGETAGRVILEGRQARVQVSFAPDDVDGRLLDRILLRPPVGRGGAGEIGDETGGASRGVPLADIVAVSQEPGFGAIRRLDGRRIVRVNGEIAAEPELRTAARRALEAEILPDIAARYGVAYSLGGLIEQERRFLSDALIAAIACALGIYATLAWIFASWTRPLAVLLVIPLGAVGALWGHYLHAQPISMFSIIGFLGLSGIIVNDAIVLTSRIDELGRRMTMAEAALIGTADRLRAVLLTTLTTVGGLAPLLFEESRQAQFLQPTVITLVYGLGIGMALVLIATPALILMQRDVAMALRSARRLLSHAARPRRGLGRRRDGASGGPTVGPSAGPNAGPRPLSVD